MNLNMHGLRLAQACSNRLACALIFFVPGLAHAWALPLLEGARDCMRSQHPAERRMLTAGELRHRYSERQKRLMPRIVCNCPALSQGARGIRLHLGVLHFKRWSTHPFLIKASLPSLSKHHKKYTNNANMRKWSNTNRPVRSLWRMAGKLAFKWSYFSIYDTISVEDRWKRPFLIGRTS